MIQITMSNKRIEYLDVAKGLLIIMVVVGHAMEIINPTHDNYLLKLIYSFHMPAFFIISGYLFDSAKWNVKGFKSYLVNRINKLLIPCFFFEYLYGIVIILFVYSLNWKG